MTKYRYRYRWIYRCMYRYSYGHRYSYTLRIIRNWHQIHLHAPIRKHIQVPRFPEPLKAQGSSRGLSSRLWGRGCHVVGAVFPHWRWVPDLRWRLLVLGMGSNRQDMVEERGREGEGYRVGFPARADGQLLLRLRGLIRSSSFTGHRLHSGGEQRLLLEA